MAQKNATPTKAQGQTITKNGLNRLAWVAIKELRCSLIVKNRFTGEIKVIDK